MNRKILKLSIPNIISNITVPLLGVADLMIIGSLGNYKLIAAIGVATAIFNLVYWNFGFLRMGTTAFTAQNYGARNLSECFSILLRAITISVTIGIILVILQKPILLGALYILNSSNENTPLVMQYFNIRIWAAPATISMYVLNGWFVGMQNAKTPMWIAICANVLNCVCSYYCAINLDMGIKGVAIGTVVSQYFSVLSCTAIIHLYYGKISKNNLITNILNGEKLTQFFHINKDIFLRSLCMCIVFTFFTSASSKSGDSTLAINTILLQMFILFSYFMDGFAYAAEALVGRYIGASNIVMTRKTVTLMNRWGITMAFVFASAYYCYYTPILGLFTKDKNLLNLALNYRGWVVALPFLSYAAFIFDGIMVGAAYSKGMRNSMFVATTLFFICYYSILDFVPEKALWLSFLLFLALRGSVEAAIFFFLQKKGNGNRIAE